VNPMVKGGIKQRMGRGGPEPPRGKEVNLSNDIMTEWVERGPIRGDKRKRKKRSEGPDEGSYEEAKKFEYHLNHA